MLRSIRDLGYVMSADDIEYPMAQLSKDKKYPTKKLFLYCLECNSKNSSIQEIFMVRNDSQKLVRWLKSEAKPKLETLTHTQM